jgi:hypothetical protein
MCLEKHRKCTPISKIYYDYEFVRLILSLIVICEFLRGISRLFYVQPRLFKKTRHSPKFASAANVLFWDADIGVKLPCNGL